MYVRECVCIHTYIHIYIYITYTHTTYMYTHITYIYTYILHTYTYNLHVHITHTHIHTRASMVTQMVKNLTAMQETWVQSLNQEDILEPSMATHSSILAGKIPWTEKPGGLQFRGSQRVRHD